jgi:copper transport protein
VRLRPGLPDGTYVATYRVVSADSHPVSGGVTFSVGSPGGGPAPAVADLVGTGAGPVTDAAFGVARAVTYGATALLAGGLVFLVLVARGVALGPAAARRASTLAIAASIAGVLAGLAGLVLQGATAAGTTIWAAVDLDTIGQVLETRFGRIWAARTVAFAVVALAALSGRGRAVAAVAAGLLVVAPAFAGHAAASEPARVLVAFDIVHVAAMSAWLGGVVALLVVVPAATRTLEPGPRSSLLARLLLRFSPLALGCIAALLATGIGQSLLHLGELSSLVDTGFGRAVLVKAALLAAIIALGAVQRRRTVPALRGLAGTGEGPGGAGRQLRSVLRAEVVLAAGVLAATSALVAYPPPDTAARGPWSDTTRIGPRALEATLEPATVGVNELHLYLLDARTGAPFDGTKELRVTASLPDKDIGPLPARPRRAGPGHYVVPGLSLVPGGDWQIEVASRTSEFDEDSTTLDVEIK